MDETRQIVFPYKGHKIRVIEIDCGVQVYLDGYGKNYYEVQCVRNGSWYVLWSVPSKHHSKLKKAVEDVARKLIRDKKNSDKQNLELDKLLEGELF